MIWLFCAALTLLVLALLLWPVLRGERDGDAADRSAYDRTVFRDQLAELERDLSRGMIGEKEAEAARNEISRRLIAAAEQGGGTHGRRLPLAIAMATVLIVPAVAVPLYLKVGNPALPDVPLQARIDRAAETGDFDGGHDRWQHRDQKIIDFHQPSIKVAPAITAGASQARWYIPPSNNGYRRCGQEQTAPARHECHNAYRLPRPHRAVPWD